MWCDDFDMDLLKVFPPIEKWFRQPLALWALCRPSAGGKINCPAAWHGLGRRGGLGTLVVVHPSEPAIPRDDHGWVSIAGYTTNDSWVRCTPLELVRDEWVHGTDIILINAQCRKIDHLPCSQWNLDFHALMMHRRGHAITTYTRDVAADAAYRSLRRLWTISQKFTRIEQAIAEGLMS